MDENRDDQLKVPLSNLAAYRKRKEKRQSLASLPAGWSPFALMGALAAGIFLGLLSGSGMGRSRN